MESLLYAGIGLSMVSAVGCLLAPSFQALFLLYSLNGIVCSLIYPMSVALVGELIPKERQADAMSKLFAVPPIITVFGSPFVGYIGARPGPQPDVFRGIGERGGTLDVRSISSQSVPS